MPALPISTEPFFWVAQGLGGTAFILVLIWTTTFRGGLAISDDLLFNLHPFLMMFGFVVLNGEGILLFRDRFWNERRGIAFHKAAHTAAFVIGSFGLAAVLLSPKESNIGNFNSLHSWIGIFIFVVYGIVLLSQWVFAWILARKPLFLYRDASGGKIDALLRSNDPRDETQEQGRMYGLLRYLIPTVAETINLENMKEPAPVRGSLRFFNPGNRFSVSTEQINGTLQFFRPNALRHSTGGSKKQGRIFGFGRFYNPGERLEPVNRDKIVNSLETFQGTLELTPGWISWHSLCGIVVYILVVGNAALGFLQKLTILENNSEGGVLVVVPKYGIEAYFVNITAIITILFGAFVILSLLGDPVTIRVEACPNRPPPPLTEAGIDV